MRLSKTSFFASVFLISANVHIRPAWAVEQDVFQQKSQIFQIDGKSYLLNELSPSDQNRLYELDLNRFRSVEGLARQRYVELKTAPHTKLNSQANPYAAEEKWLNQKFAPTTAEVEKALEQYKDEKQLQQLPVAERGQAVERFLTSQKRAKALTEATDRAIEKGDIVVSLRRPDAPTFEISKGVQAAIGESKSPVRVVEFTDFQCPYCKKFSAITGQVLKKYGSKISWEVRHFPLSFHKEARAAAAAVFCASRQGKLSEAKAWVFDAQSRLAEEKIYSDMGKSLKLNAKEFDVCRSDESTARVIEADIREGERLGVSGTPTVFVNGRRFQGDPHSMDAWDALLAGPALR
jgi:protein-disulfide isomerase